MRELPTGTVTFLFTDVEGSTGLLHELGDAYAGVLAEHRRVLRASFARHGGVEVDTQGDAFFIAFARAKDALAAAVDAQAALVTGPIRVRMGLHTGEPLVTEEGYVGIDVHRAARIAAIGHGGQILVSQTTHHLLHAQLELRDLGEHRLKDLGARERIYQLGRADFPPLKSLNQTNLPMQPTPLIGREQELADALELLRANRLVTLTGPGGSGKTRLALQAAAELVEEFPDGVWFVSLAPLRDPELLEPTIAQTLGVKEPQTVGEHLASKQALLLLDNFEQLLDTAPALADLLAQAARLKLLVTSRACLRLSGEHEYPVPPLSDSEAIELFVERAQAAKPGFGPDEHVSEICRRLDNLPLALELAAVWVKLLAPEAMLVRLENRLPLLTGGPRDAPERQQTLRSTIEWSHDLLDERERELFARLAVFAGGFTLEAADEVAGADLQTLVSLVDKSLVRERGERFGTLATIREYARERLDANIEAEAVRRRHAEHYLALAEAAEPEILRGSQVEWLARVEAELDNFRAALRWLLDLCEAELALRLIGSLRRAWVARGHLTETRHWLETALATDGDTAVAVRAKALYGYGRVALVQGDYATAVPQLERSATLFRQVDDPNGLAYSLADLGWIAAEQGQFGRARRFAEESVAVARAAGDKTTIAAGLHSLACATLDEGDYARARELFEESLNLRRELGDKRNSANSLSYLGAIALLEGEYTHATGLLEEALALANELDNVLLVAAVLVNLGLVALFEEDPVRAAALATESLALAQELGDRRTIVECLHALGGVAAAERRPRRAAVLAAAADALHEAIGAPPLPAERAVSARFIDRARAENEELFQEGWALGRAMTIEKALEYAVEAEATTKVDSAA